jgi:hypothetical protein
VPNVVINFSNVSISVAVVLVGGALTYTGYTNNIINMKNTGLILLFLGVCLYVALLEIYGKKT